MSIFLALSALWQALFFSPQMFPFPGNPAGGGGGVTFALVQHASNSCGGGATCAVTVTSTTAGNLLVAFGANNTGANNLVFSSMTGEGTWTHCSGGHVATLNAGSTTFYQVDCAYILSATGGTTSLTWTWSASAGKSTIEIIEVSRTSGSWALDVNGILGDASCTTCASPTLTLSGSNDYIFQYSGLTASTLSAISGSYTSPADFITSGLNGYAGFAGWNGGTSGASVNWTGSPTDTLPTGAIAFK